MSNFKCNECGADIFDSPNGYITWCEHWPRERTDTLKNNMNILSEYVKDRLLAQEVEKQAKGIHVYGRVIYEVDGELELRILNEDDMYLKGEG